MNGESVEKLEKDFSIFQKEWRKFLTNDFPCLQENVASLVAQNREIISVVKSVENHLATVQKAKDNGKTN